MRWPAESRPALLHALGVVLVQTVCTQAAIRALVAATPGTTFEGNPVEFGILAAYVAAGTALVMYLGVHRWGGGTLGELGWRVARPVASVVGGVVGFAAIAGCLLGMVATIAPGAVEEVLATVSSYTPRQRLLFAFVGLNAAWLEESVFRGVVQPAFVARWGKAGGIVAMALLFAVYHLIPNPIGLAGKAIVGVVCGVLRDRTGSLLAPGIAHFLVWAILGTA